MRGYFSRIARQSGLNISATHANLSQQAGDGERLLKPLERIETLIISPRPVEPTRPEAPAAKRGAIPEGRFPEDIGRKPVQEKVGDHPDPEQIVDSSPIGEMVSPAGTVTDYTAFEPEISQRKQDNFSQQSRAAIQTKTTSPGNTQPVGVGHSMTTEGHENQSLAQQRTASTESGGKGEKAEKRFFVRTAEIVGGRAAEPVEAQNILLSEIKEWVAAGNPPKPMPGAGANIAEAEVKSSEAIESKEFAQIAQPGPESGVVRNSEKSLTASAIADSPRIDEQGFDLSIGTISVVIEGDENPTSSFTAVRETSRPNRVDTGCSQSRRLRRNYL